MTESEAIERLLQVIRSYDQAAEKFLDKCDRGEAFSKNTRRDLTHCIELSRSITGQVLAGASHAS